MSRNRDVDRGTRLTLQWWRSVKRTLAQQRGRTCNIRKARAARSGFCSNRSRRVRKIKAPRGSPGASCGNFKKLVAWIFSKFPTSSCSPSLEGGWSSPLSSMWT